MTPESFEVREVALRKRWIGQTISLPNEVMHGYPELLQRAIEGVWERMEHRARETDLLILEPPTQVAIWSIYWHKRKVPIPRTFWDRLLCRTKTEEVLDMEDREGEHPGAHSYRLMFEAPAVECAGYRTEIERNLVSIRSALRVSNSVDLFVTENS